jgi:hypothetical protein
VDATRLLRSVREHCGGWLAFIALRHPDRRFDITSVPEPGIDNPWTEQSLSDLAASAWDDPRLRLGEIVVGGAEMPDGVWPGRSGPPTFAAAPLLAVGYPDGLCGLLCIAKAADSPFTTEQLTNLAAMADELAAHLCATEVGGVDDPVHATVPAPGAASVAVQHVPPAANAAPPGGAPATPSSAPSEVPAVVHHAPSAAHVPPAPPAQHVPSPPPAQPLSAPVAAEPAAAPAPPPPVPAEPTAAPTEHAVAPVEPVAAQPDPVDTVAGEPAPTAVPSIRVTVPAAMAAAAPEPVADLDVVADGPDPVPSPSASEAPEVVQDEVGLDAAAPDPAAPAPPDEQMPAPAPPDAVAHPERAIPASADRTPRAPDPAPAAPAAVAVEAAEGVNSWLLALVDADPLTSLAGPVTFLARTQATLANTDASDYEVVVVLVDLGAPDGSGAVPENDLLMAIAAQLRGQMRPNDVIGRVSPTTFAVLAVVPLGVLGASAIAYRLAEAISMVADGFSSEWVIRSSFAAADPNVDAEELFRKAVVRLGT